MSDFSLLVTSDLKLKPEITAPGGDIYSTLPNGLYGNMSGTSMASPHMAGAAAVMQQYISENRDGINMTAEQRTSLFNALMMSTRQFPFGTKTVFRTHRENKVRVLYNYKMR